MGQRKHNESGYLPLLFLAHLGDLATSWRTNAHPIDLSNKGSYIDLHGNTFSLIFLEGLINSSSTFEVSVDSGRFSLKIVIFELEVHRRGYNIQCNNKRSS